MTKYLFLIAGSFMLAVNCFAASQDITVAWDEPTGSVEYNLPGNATVKLRACSPEGAVLKTMINCEPRPAGISREKWVTGETIDGADLGLGKDLLFVVETGERMQKDRLLKVQAGAKETTFMVDVEGGIKKGTAFKVMVFVNNKLVKLLRADMLPCPVALKGNFKKGDLFTFNLWPSDHSWAGYKSFAFTPRSAQSAGRITGNFLYCRRQNDFWQIFSSGLNGNNETQLTKDDSDKSFPAFSPDRGYIAYTKNNGELWVMNADGKNPKMIDLGKKAYHPVWSADSKRILFASLDDPYHGDSNIWEVERATGKSKCLLNRPWFQYDAVYAPDGTKLAFVDGPELFGRDIYTVDLKAGSVTQLTENNSEIYDIAPAYFPDGENIVYLNNSKDGYNLWVMDKFGRDPVRLTQGEFYNNNPCPAADNKSIFFLSDRDGYVNVWRINRDAGGLTQITFDKSDKKDLSIITKAGE